MAASALVGYLWLTAQNIDAERTASDIKYLSDLIQLNKGIDPATLRRFVGDAYAVADRNECRTDILYAGAAVILADLDRISTSETFEALNRPLTLAQTYFVHALSCAPTNGDAWARLAMVRLALGATPEEVASLLERSRQFAPADGATLVGRLAVWVRAPEATLKIANEALDWDLGIAFSRFSTANLAESFSQSSVAIQKRILPLAVALPPDRVRQLKRSGLSFLPDPPTPPDALSH